MITCCAYRSKLSSRGEGPALFNYGALPWRTGVLLLLERSPAESLQSNFVTLCFRVFGFLLYSSCVAAALLYNHDAIRGARLNALTAFGLFAVTAMLIFYALERRSPWFIFAFALACALASVYGFLQGAWPFGAVEAVWSVVALRRWWLARPVK